MDSEDRKQRDFDDLIEYVNAGLEKEQKVQNTYQKYMYVYNEGLYNVLVVLVEERTGCVLSPATYLRFWHQVWRACLLQACGDNSGARRMWLYSFNRADEEAARTTALDSE